MTEDRDTQFKNFIRSKSSSELMRSGFSSLMRDFEAAEVEKAKLKPWPPEKEVPVKSLREEADEYLTAAKASRLIDQTKHRIRKKG